MLYPSSCPIPSSYPSPSVINPHFQWARIRPSRWLIIVFFFHDVSMNRIRIFNVCVYCYVAETFSEREIIKLNMEFLHQFLAICKFRVGRANIEISTKLSKTSPRSNSAHLIERDNSLGGLWVPTTSMNVCWKIWNFSINSLLFVNSGRAARV